MKAFHRSNISAEERWRIRIRVYIYLDLIMFRDSPYSYQSHRNDDPDANLDGNLWIVYVRYEFQTGTTQFLTNKCLTPWNKSLEDMTGDMIRLFYGGKRAT